MKRKPGQFSREMVKDLLGQRDAQIEAAHVLLREVAEVLGTDAEGKPLLRWYLPESLAALRERIVTELRLGPSKLDASGS